MNFFSFFKKPPIILSSFNPQLRIQKRFGHKAVVVDGVTQSGGELTVMWESVAKSIKKELSPNSCLMLGLAGGTMLTILQRTFPKVKITVLEIDPTMIELSKNEFGISKKNTTIVLTDAFGWCKLNSGMKQFDCIVVDLYVGRYNPPEARTEHFIKTLITLLSPSGIVCFNTHYDKKNKQDFKDIIILFNKYFVTVSKIYSYPLNKIILLQNIRTKQTK